MVLEVVLLNIRPGQTAAFESALSEVLAIIASMPGYLLHDLARCLEDPHRYLLLIEWETLESPTIEFCQSAAYLEWQQPLHHFYHPFPTVDDLKPMLERARA